MDKLTTYNAIKPDITTNIDAAICNLYDFKSSPSSLDILNNSKLTYKNTKDKTSINI